MKNSSGSLSDTVKCLITINTRTEALVPIEGVRNTRKGDLNWVSPNKIFSMVTNQVHLEHKTINEHTDFYPGSVLTKLL